MNRIRRIISRVLFYSIKVFLSFISLFNHRIYMRLYIPLLRQYGITMNGKPRYIAKSVKFDDFDKITLSERDVISGNVEFLTHDYSYTTCLISQGLVPDTDIAIVRDIKIGRNVFIGARSFIFPGTIIGDNCIIGAGSFVRGEIPEGSVCIGNPASVIKKIDELYNKKWKNLSISSLRKD